MKKTLIALAALGAMAGAAQAQSTVTIYGLLDANIGSYKTNQVNAAATAISGISQSKIDSGGLNGSRWGIRLKEDIGGGMSVVGNLESGFSIDTGAQGQGALFGRRANVGISSGFGTVTLGRNSSSYDDVSADHAMMGATLFDPSNTNNGFTTAQAGAIGTLAGNAVLLNHGVNGSGAHVTWVGFNTRFNNSVKYVSPNFGGFTGSFMYAFGEDKTTTVGASNSTSANLRYANGPLLISGGYQSEGATRTATAKPALTNTLLNVSYDFGVAKVGFGANRAKFKDVTTTFRTGVAHELAAQKEYSLSVAVPLGATTLSAGYARSKGDDLGSSTGWGVQALYSLSKRTTLYVGGVSTKNYENVAANTMVIAPTSNITRTTTYAAGIRHTF
ncbi:porin [Polaromonas sp. YR568]|uniref:porin n=1 Tax=Polaromonas sp. YR568 TaxID=1855301 RepID=UPI00398C1DE9